MISTSCVDRLIAKRFVAIHETEAGPKWQTRFQETWPSYKSWFFRHGDASRASYTKSAKMLKQHMPELMPVYNRLVDLAGGSDSVARFLAHYDPPPYFAGCTQVAWSGYPPALIRNYDYSASRLEGTLLTSKWVDKTVTAMIDASWGVLDGINESGLSVSLAFGGRTNVGEGFGVPVILRYILEFCETTSQATEMLSRIPSNMSYNITVLDRHSRFATAYIAPDRDTVVRQNPVATNHQNKIEWARHAWATATLERESEVQTRLADPEENLNTFISCFLRPPVFNSSYERGFGTLYTAIYSPTDATAKYIWPNHTWYLDMQQPFEDEYVAHYQSLPNHLYLPNL